MDDAAVVAGKPVPASGWNRLRRILEEGAALGVVEFVEEFPPQSAAELAAPLREFERALRDRAGPGWRRQRAALVLAGVAILPSTLLVARWLGRYAEVHGCASGIPVGQLLVRMLRGRPREWLADLVARLARQDRIGRDQIWLIGEVAGMAGVGLPATDAVARGWARSGAPQTGAAWDPVLLRTFDAEGTGRYLVRWDGNGFAEAVLEAVASGRISRAEVLDRCVQTLGHRCQVGDVRGYLAMYRRLAPTAEEVGVREAAFLRLLGAPHVPVAALAQSELIRANAAGRVEDGCLLAATRTVFLRRDRGMALAQVAWLDAVLTRKPDHADAVRGSVQPWPGLPDEDVLAEVRRLAARHLTTDMAAVLRPRPSAGAAAVSDGTGRSDSSGAGSRAVPFPVPGTRTGEPHQPHGVIASADLHRPHPPRARRRGRGAEVRRQDELAARALRR
ncbi:hypothetical protein, partial [Amycolatopsis sp. NPDC000740]|uniref:hypothetical protein n=1 Tax=Amycolatopsis sp. NPDC000740 TaxID=3154269 RepID=UPI00332A92C3